MRIVISENERALMFRNGRFEKILEPGEYSWLFATNEIEIKRFDIRYPEFSGDWANVLLRNHPETVREHFEMADVSDTEIGIVRLNGKAHSLIAPGSLVLYWNALQDVSIEKTDISDHYEIDPKKIQKILDRHGGALANLAEVITVENSFIGLLFTDGEYVKTLKPGKYGFIKANRSIRVKQVDTRLQHIDIAGQDILTADRVGIRLNLGCHYKIVDPVKATLEIKEPFDFLYKEIQFILREVVGTRTLDQILANKEHLNEEVAKRTGEKMRDTGISISMVGIKDIILPGEMREIMNTVIEAERMAQANIIKRREETAATRSLLNTAKLMDQNPTLMRLKELETLEKLMDKVDRVNVSGGFEGILNELIKTKQA